MADRKLTEKQKKFIDFYIETGNATEAAEKAGYSKKTAKEIGYENLTKLHFFIEQELKKKDDARIASQDEVLKFLTSMMRNEITEEVVVVEGQGQGMSEARIIDKSISAKDRLEAAKSLAKRFGIDKPSNENNNDAINENLLSLAKILQTPQPPHEIKVDASE